MFYEEIFETHRQRARQRAREREMMLELDKIVANLPNFDY